MLYNRCDRNMVDIDINIKEKFEQLIQKVRGQTVDLDKGLVLCVIKDLAKGPIYNVNLNDEWYFRIVVKVKTIPLGSTLSKIIYINRNLFYSIDNIENLSFKMNGDFIEVENVGNTVLESI